LCRKVSTQKERREFPIALLGLSRDRDWREQPNRDRLVRAQRRDAAVAGLHGRRTAAGTSRCANRRALAAAENGAQDRARNGSAADLGALELVLLSPSRSTGAVEIGSRVPSAEQSSGIEW
jgi:hypothetical protein